MSLNASVSDDKYERPANPYLCLLADARSGIMIAAEMTGPEEDEKITLAEITSFIYIASTERQKEVRVRSVITEAILEQTCREGGH